MKIIIVAGSPNTGKTSSTNLLITKMLDNGYKFETSLKDGSISEFWKMDGKLKIDSGSAILVKDGKKYLIFTYGDTKTAIDTLFNEINSTDYECVVCCSHAMKGKNVFNLVHDKLNDFDLAKTSIIPIFKNMLCDYGNDLKENEYTADLLYKLLNI